MIYKGGCHCGRIAFEVEGEIESLIDCNCTICRRRGALHWFVPREKFRLLTPETATGSYTFHKHVIKHRFCLDCGCAPYSEGRKPSGAYMVAVNARCLEGVDLAAMKVVQFDGLSL
jgi:hypothetical protein